LAGAAGSVLQDIESGKITDPAEYEAEVVATLREQFSLVHGPGDLLWELQVDVCRQVLEAGGLSADEVAEWVAVLRRRETGAYGPQRPQGDRLTGARCLSG
jgi:hypothetical protein